MAHPSPDAGLVRQGVDDRILERATDEEMAAGNRLWYIINEEFQWEMARSVRRAEDYHVLWIHDVSGVNHHGDPDNMAFLQVVNYLEALIERVKAYDETRKLPMYMIMLDQHYFEANKSRLWANLLTTECLTDRQCDHDDHEAWAGAFFSPGASLMAPANLSSKSALSSFWALGDGKTYSVMFFAESLGYLPATRTFVAGPSWAHHSFTFEEFGIDGHGILGIFLGGGNELGDFALEIDEVRLD